MTRTIELTDDEIVQIRVSMMLRLARLRHAIENTTDAADVADVRTEARASCVVLEALLAGKMRREGQ